MRTALLLACCVLLGCSSSGTTPGTTPSDGASPPPDGASPPPDGTSAPPETRAATLRAATSKYDQLGLEHADPVEQNRAMAAWLAGLPDVAQSGYDVGGAWARFTEGDILVLDNIDRPTTAASVASVASVASPAAPPPISRWSTVVQPRSLTEGESARSGLPSTRVACIYSAGDVKRGWLKVPEEALKKANYQIRPNPDASVEDLTTSFPGNCGVLVLNAHASVRALAQDGSQVYSVQTATDATPELVVRYWSDLTSKPPRLTYYHPFLDRAAVVDPSRIFPNFAVTAAGVAKWWTFPANSFVYMGLCSAGSAVAASFREAVTRPVGGASLYAAFDGSFFTDDKAVGAANAGHVLDRLTGANLFDEPAHRPFPYHALFKEMVDRNLVLADDKYGSTRFDFTPGAGDVALLAPSIKRLVVHESKKTLELEGLFGSDPGSGMRQVTITPPGAPPGTQGKACPITSWAPESIECTLGDDDFGDVRVESLERPSNTVQLTRWTGVCAQRLIVDSVFPGISHTQGTWETQWDVRLRADVHPHRERPGEEPAATPSTLLLAPGSSGTISANATTIEFYAGAQTGTFVTNCVGKLDQVAYTLDSDVWFQTRVFTGGHVDPANNQGALRFRVYSAEETGNCWTVHRSTDDGKYDVFPESFNMDTTPTFSDWYAPDPFADDLWLSGRSDGVLFRIGQDAAISFEARHNEFPSGLGMEDFAACNLQVAAPPDPNAAR